MGSSPPPPPKPSAEELELRRTQNRLLNQQIEQNKEQNEFFNELKPDLLENFKREQEFRTKTLDLNTRLLDLHAENFESEAEFRKAQLEFNRDSFEFIKELLPSEEVTDLQEELTLAYGERALQAIRGELPVDKSIVKGFDDARDKLDLRFSELLGSGYETSSTYLDALNDLSANREIAYDSARRGDLTTAAQLFGNSLNQSLAGIGASGGYNAPQLPNFLNPNAGGNSLSTIGQLSQVQTGNLNSIIGNAGNLAGQYFNDRSLAYQGQLQGYQSQQATLGSIFGGIATLGGAALGAGGWGGLLGI